MVSKTKKETKVNLLEDKLTFLFGAVDSTTKENIKLQNKILELEQVIQSYQYKIKALQVSQEDIWDNIEEIEAKINVKCNSKPQNNTDS